MLGSATQIGASEQMGYDASLAAGIGKSWVMAVDDQPPENASSPSSTSDPLSTPNLSGHRNIPC